MLRVYVMGPYSCAARCEGTSVSLEHMARGMAAGAELLARGFAPFTPWHDYHHALIRPDIPKAHFYQFSIAWLQVADCCLALEGWENSKGTLAEIKLAEELHIPVFYSIDELERWVLMERQEEDITWAELR